MNNKTLTILAIGAAVFFLLSFNKGSGKKKKKLKPVIKPLPLQNITAKEYYGTKNEFKSGVAEKFMNMATEGLITASNITSDVNKLPIANELKTAMQPGCC